MDKYEMIRDILDKSSYTVAMCGTDMMKESGMPSLRAPEIAYQVEKEYGYSPEEIFFFRILYEPYGDVFQLLQKIYADAAPAAERRLLRTG